MILKLPEQTALIICDVSDAAIAVAVLLLGVAAFQSLILRLLEVVVVVVAAEAQM